MRALRVWASSQERSKDSQARALRLVDAGQLSGLDGAQVGHGGGQPLAPNGLEVVADRGLRDLEGAGDLPLRFAAQVAAGDVLAALQDRQALDVVGAGHYPFS
jgi:hypothetical protein